MIEVEKKFQPTEEQLGKLLEGAEFLGEKILHDTYYDYPDYRMFKNGTRFRNRNGGFELKIGQGGGVAEELERYEEIQKYFGINIPLAKFIEENMISFIDYSTKRQKYKKQDFEICVDELDFGLNVVEIELMVDNEKDIQNATQKILEFGNSFSILEVNGLVKRKEYFKKVKPELYNQLCKE